MNAAAPQPVPTRPDLLARLGDERFDVLVIGGGATGLGCALDAASRGLRTALVEAADFAQATSSRSTKLIHGGVRYLQQGNLSLVREALRERRILLHNAPHLVRTLPLVVPLYQRWERAYYGIGLALYDALARDRDFAPSRRLDRDAALHELPNVARDGLRGGVLYSDAQFDDARLAWSLARSALGRGACVLNHLRVAALLKEQDRVQGALALDAESGREHRIAARVVINATGIFSDSIRALDEAGQPLQLQLSQGAHLVLPRRFLPGRSAILVPRTDDGRVLFVLPWQGRVLLGTTDTPVEGAEAEPQALASEVDFLLANAARYLEVDPQPGDVLSVFAGLRPLVRRTHESGETKRIGREHQIRVDPSGLVSVVGGKWTTYRAMAEQTVDLALRSAGLTVPPSATAALRLHGAAAESAEPGAAPDGAESEVEAHRRGYGSDLPALDALAAALPQGAACLHPDLPLIEAEVVWAARCEMARRVEDVLARRTRALLLDARAAAQCAPRVAELLAQELGRPAQWIADETRAFQQLARSYRLPPG